MPTYYVNEAMFTLPERGFVDRTIHRLAAPRPGQDPLVVTARRVPLQPGKTLREQVEAELASSAAQVTSFAVVGEAEIALAGLPAILVRVRWRADDAAHYQVQVHVALEETWLSFAVTAPWADRGACDETFDRVARTLTWRSA
jgi:hypothetical protein